MKPHPELGTDARAVDRGAHEAALGQRAVAIVPAHFPAGQLEAIKVEALVLGGERGEQQLRLADRIAFLVDRLLVGDLESVAGSISDARLKS